MLVSVCSVVIHVHGQGASKQQGFFPADIQGQQMLSVVYPGGMYDETCQCLLWQPPKPDRAQWQEFFGDYLNAQPSLTVRLKSTYPFVQQKIRKYFLLTEALPAQADYHCHVCAPVLGGAIVAQTEQGWTIEAQSQAVTALGGFGVSPENQFVQIGPEQYGVMFDVWAGNQGCYDQQFVLFAMQAGKVAILAEVEGGTLRTDCLVPDVDHDARYEFIPQNGAIYFPLKVTTTVSEGHVMKERVQTYQFSQGRYALISDEQNSFPLPEWILIDVSVPVYTVFMTLPKDFPPDELTRIKTRIANQKGFELLRWEQFQPQAERYIASRLVKNDYPEIALLTGLLDMLIQYPGTPVGVTWNGGIAITAMDYQYADKMYQTYQADPEAYERTRKKDPKADPVHPQHHFDALSEQKK